MKPKGVGDGYVSIYDVGGGAAGGGGSAEAPRAMLSLSRVAESDRGGHGQWRTAWPGRGGSQWIRERGSAVRLATGLPAQRTHLGRDCGRPVDAAFCDAGNPPFTLFVD